MNTGHAASSVSYHPDDIAVWPDGTWATLGEIGSGELSWRSDDYEIVKLESIERLRELGIADELDL